MAETTKDQKLVQYLGEAYGKEKELEAALHSHIQMTDRAAYRKRLQQHLGETKNHARLVERRISKLGGGGHLLQNLAARGSALAKAPMHARRGKSAEERMLKNAKTEYSEEAEEIATYTAIETLADTVGDSETARMARQIRRELLLVSAVQQAEEAVLAPAGPREADLVVPAHLAVHRLRVAATAEARRGRVPDGLEDAVEARLDLARAPLEEFLGGNPAVLGRVVDDPPGQAEARLEVEAEVMELALLRRRQAAVDGATFCQVRAVCETRP